MLGGSTYNVINSCTDFGGVYFSKDDTKPRVLSLCLDTERDQLEQVAEHELLHICMHNHVHNFKTEQELKEHLEKQEYTEEMLVTKLAPCLIEDEDRLYTALYKVRHNEDIRMW